MNEKLAPLPGAWIRELTMVYKAADPSLNILMAFQRAAAEVLWLQKQGLVRVSEQAVDAHERTYPDQLPDTLVYLIDVQDLAAHRYPASFEPLDSER